jgi:hypothetical protein
MNVLLKAKITDTYLGVVDINGYKYNKHKMQVKQLDDIDVLIPVFEDVYSGDCIATEKWVLTCLSPKTKPIEIIVRIDAFERVSPEDFEISEYLNSKITGLLCNSSNCVLKTVGVDKKAFYNCTLKVKNSFNESFDLYILGFSKNAKMLSTIKGGSVIECIVTAKRSQKNAGWEFPVSDITVKSEVKES